MLPRASLVVGLYGEVLINRSSRGAGLGVGGTFLRLRRALERV